MKRVFSKIMLTLLLSVSVIQVRASNVNDCVTGLAIGLGAKLIAYTLATNIKQWSETKSLICAASTSALASYAFTEADDASVKGIGKDPDNLIDKILSTKINHKSILKKFTWSIFSYALATQVVGVVLPGQDAPKVSTPATSPVPLPTAVPVKK